MIQICISAGRIGDEVEDLKVEGMILGKDEIG
jgi:hypothetical protein